jgi:uncharacterized protein
MSAPWHPVETSERYQVLDLARGFALYGVLIVNLLYFFRVSLFSHIVGDGGDAGWIDVLVQRAIEFKAFDLFSLSFGIGVAVQAERARKRGVGVAAFLARRFAILLAFGLVHVTLVANLDILCLYAICGLALIPLILAPWQVLLPLGVVAVLAQNFVPIPFPGQAALRAHGVEATLVYTHAGFADVTAYRWHETLTLMLPLFAAVAVKTYGLMLGGMALWKSGVIRDRDRHRRWIWIAGAVAAVAWLVTREHIPLALAYGAALLAWRPSERSKRWTAWFAAAGRMAFTNYLTQSLIFAVMFYGFGLMGRMEVAPAAALGTALYGVQVWFSVRWLRTHRFGPFEWVWRSLTYGRRV